MPRMMKISDIKIKDSYANTIPSEEKMNECRRNYLIYGKQDRYIVVNQRNELIDGYIMYLILKEQGVSEAEVKIYDRKQKRWHRKDITGCETPYYRNNSTTYIFGKHTNSKVEKEYVWRVPNNWTDWTNDLNIGDVIICQTKFGRSPVIVTRIEKLDSCPINQKVKRVIAKAKEKKNEKS